MTKYDLELGGLEVEAERLVRDGYSRAEVSRMLRVHPQTLAGWALRNGWRKKDLEAERADAAIGRAIARINRSRMAEAEARAGAGAAGRWRRLQAAIEGMPEAERARALGRLKAMIAQLEAAPGPVLLSLPVAEEDAEGGE